MDAVVAFVGAGVWLGAHLWVRRTRSDSNPFDGWALLALTGSVLGPILWVSIGRRLTASWVPPTSRYGV